jgi:hypothetical protein
MWAGFLILLGLASFFFVSCFAGTKIVGEGKDCRRGDPGFSGDVVCDDGLVCLPANGGYCFRACKGDNDCGADRVCAAGACVSPCDPSIEDLCYGVCCLPPPGGAPACLPPAECKLWGTLPSPPDAGADAARADGAE